METLKQNVREALGNPQSRYFGATQLVLFATTLASIAVAAVTLFEPTIVHKKVTVLFGWGTVAVFTVEYAARLWSAERRIVYARSFLGLVDLASILPSYLGLGDFAFLKVARIVRMFRALRLLGITSAARYLPKKRVDEKRG